MIENQKHISYFEQMVIPSLFCTDKAFYESTLKSGQRQGASKAHSIPQRNSKIR